MPVSKPALTQVLGPVVKDLAALAERLQVPLTFYDFAGLYRNSDAHLWAGTPQQIAALP